MLELDLISEDSWVAGRADTPEKWHNLYKLRNFHKVIENIKAEYTGYISYHKFNKKYPKQLINTLEYTENSPIFEYFKLSPYSYYLNHFPDDNLWRSCDIDSNIYSIFSNTNKYPQPDTVFSFDKPYVLFALQANRNQLPHSFNPEILIRTVLWATKTKNYVLFKIHPFMLKDSLFVRYWSYLDSLGYITEYTILVDKSYNLDSLITNSEQVWTFSSGAGMQAIIAGKPVSHFYSAVDYSAIANYATTPEEAYTCKLPSCEDRTRFLTWYFTKLTINSESAELEQRLRHRLEQFFVNKHTEIAKIL